MFLYVLMLKITYDDDQTLKILNILDFHAMCYGVELHWYLQVSHQFYSYPTTKWKYLKSVDQQTQAERQPFSTIHQKQQIQPQNVYFNQTGNVNHQPSIVSKRECVIKNCFEGRLEQGP